MRRFLTILTLCLIAMAVTPQVTGAGEKNPNALTTSQAAALCPLAPGQSGSVQLFDNHGGDAYYYVANCGALVASVNHASKNKDDFYFTGIGGVLP